MRLDEPSPVVVDVVTGPPIPKYTREAVRFLSRVADVRLLVSRAYGGSRSAIAYRLMHHPVVVRNARRRGAIIHIDHQLLAYLCAFRSLSPVVLTCHDLVTFMPQFDDPSYVRRDRLIDRAYYWGLAAGLRRADRIVADSEHTRKDLLAFGIQPDHIDVVPNGVDLERYRPQDRARCRDVLARYGIRDSRVILFVGTESPRKNLRGLFRAFARLAPETDAVLLKVGSPRQPQRTELMQLATRLGIRERIVFIDSVPEEELPLIYGGADVLVLPSLYEGFGLPPLEAMACGTPVIVSNSTSLPEVVGDAGVYVDPTDEGGIAAAIERVFEDRPLREELRGKGLARAAQFGWERTTAGLLRVYKRTLALA